MSYEQELEKRIQQLESLWENESKLLEDIVNIFQNLKDEVSALQLTVSNLQDPNSTTNKHGIECYKLVKEKVDVKYETILRKINAAVSGLNQYRKINT
jgi:site-specific DNA-adenine methylase